MTKTCRFKLEPSGEDRAILEDLFKTYFEMVKTCLDKAVHLKITSCKRLHETVYWDLRLKYPNYSSHYIYTVVTQALIVFKSHKMLSRGGS
ncbi:MAG: hypothetical protein KIH01_01735 [Candidatus Freyarchaeota archaeon]|nr:hypothetical protein [Candidatus Jordarchaeia archaeon]